MIDIEDSVDFIIFRIPNFDSILDDNYRLWKLVEKFQIVVNDKNTEIEALKEQIANQSDIIGKLCKKYPKTNSSIPEQYKCIACYNEIKAVIYLPCFHIVYCSTCDKKDNSNLCPICRNQIIKKVNIF